MLLNVEFKLVKPKIKDILLKTAIIANKNGGKMWEVQIGITKRLILLQVRSRSEELVEVRDPDAVSIKHLNTIFNVVCLLLLLIPKRTSQFIVQFVPVVGLFKINLFCHFSQKPSTPPNCLPFPSLLNSHRFQILNTT